MRKKFICGMVLAMVMSACLIGCGNQGGDAAKSDGYSTATSQPVDISEETMKKLQEGAKERGVDVAPSGNYIDYKVNGDTLTITGKGAMGAMPISLCFGEMSETKDIKKVIIDKGITSINDSAFKDCVNLESVELPEGLTTIYADSFRNTGIKSIVIPNTTKYIYTGAFLECKNLKEVTMPGNISVQTADEFDVSKVNSIEYPVDKVTFTTPLKKDGKDKYTGYNGLCLCFRTKAYEISNKDPKYASYKGAIYTKDMTKLIKVGGLAESVEISPKTKQISVWAFGEYQSLDDEPSISRLKKITIPSNVTKVVGEGVNECLKKVEIDYSQCKFDDAQSYKNLELYTKGK